METILENGCSLGEQNPDLDGLLATCRTILENPDLRPLKLPSTSNSSTSPTAETTTAVETGKSCEDSEEPGIGLHALVNNDHDSKHRNGLERSDLRKRQPSGDQEGFALPYPTLTKPYLKARNRSNACNRIHPHGKHPNISSISSSGIIDNSPERTSATQLRSDTAKLNDSCIDGGVFYRPNTTSRLSQSQTQTNSDSKYSFAELTWTTIERETSPEMNDTGSLSSISMTRSFTHSPRHHTSRIVDFNQENANLKSQIMVLRAQLAHTKSKLKTSESNLSQTYDKLLRAEDRLQQEQYNKTYMETHKLDLMSEIAELRTRVKAVEAERSQYRNRYEQLQSQVHELNENLRNKDRELVDLKVQASNGTTARFNGADHSGSNGFLLNGGGMPEGEYDSLKQCVKDLMQANKEKDSTIEELRKAVTAYQKVEEIILHSRTSRPRSDTVDSSRNQSEVGYTGLTVSTPTTPRNNIKDSVGQFFTSPPPNKKPLTVQRSNSYDASRFNRVCLSDNLDDDRKRNPSASSLPRDHHNRVNMTADRASRKTGQGYESDVFSEDDDGTPQKRKSGFKRFLAKLKRAGSQETVHSDTGSFKRGGVRATAGPRLGTNKQQDHTPKSDSFLTPFGRWTSDQVATWLHDIGLAPYVGECRKFCRSGQHMLEASTNELNKELRIQNPLHRKKLHLALDAIKTGSRKDQVIMNMKPDWICKWLDDIGLPQYKDSFYDVRMDGRMLNNLTVHDLLFLKVNNALHHLSIRRGVEILRKHNFDLATLKRRPTLNKMSTTESNTMIPTGSRKQGSCTDVTLWTNHRVMEWLRMIDLSEYAANLRGSGVHGALIMLESRFTVEHLASILNIPTSKTLLRRHLNVHFVNLVGSEVQAKKRETEQVPSLGITINQKIKPKKSHLFRRGKSIPEYVCPFEIEPIDTSQGGKSDDRRVKDAVAAYKKGIVKRDSNNSKAPQEPITDYNQFSQEMKQLTGLLKNPMDTA